MNQVKSKMSNLQTKLECAVGQLKGTFMDYRDTKDDEDATEERDIAIVVIQKKWDKMKTISTSLSEAIEKLAEIVSEDGTEISGDPSKIIATSNKEAKEAHKEYLNFKQEHSKEMRGNKENSGRTR